MKRVKAGIIRIIKSRKFHFALIALAIFCAGMIAGFFLKGQLIKGDTSQNSSSRTTAQSSQERTQRSLERLEDSYKRAQERIKKDVEAKRIEQSQADEINRKLDEIYNYKKDNSDVGDEDKRQELQKKRAEWREWLEQNNVSSRYFVGVI